jgi:ABC-type sugar transport system ATPase subunit
MNNEPLLRMQNIKKVFSGVTALDNVNLTLERVKFTRWSAKTARENLL